MYLLSQEINSDDKIKRETGFPIIRLPGKDDLLTVQKIKMTNGKLGNAVGKHSSQITSKTLCAWCKRLRNDHGLWTETGIVAEEHPETLFTHGICPECFQKYTAEMNVIDTRMKDLRGNR